MCWIWFGTTSPPFGEDLGYMKNNNKVLTIAAAFCFALISAGCPTQPGQDPEFDRYLNEGFEYGVRLVRDNPASTGAECETLGIAGTRSIQDTELYRKAIRAGCWFGYGAYVYGVGMANHEAPDHTACNEYPSKIDEILVGYYNFRVLTTAERTKLINACRLGYADTI